MGGRVVYEKLSYMEVLVCVEYLGRLISERVLMGYGGKFLVVIDYVWYYVIYYGREFFERLESKGGSWKRN